MIAFADLLVGPAKQAGIQVPEVEDLNDLNSVRETHSHWFVYCNVQLGRRMPDATSHWENAKVVAALTAEEVRKVTLAELEARGFA